MTPDPSTPEQNSQPATPSISGRSAWEYLAEIRGFLSERLAPRRRWRRADWRLWAGMALLLASIVVFSWQPMETYTTYNYCSYCYFGYNFGVGLLGGWGIGAFGALIGWAMLVATFTWATWRPDRAQPVRLELIPTGVMVAAVVVLVLHTGEVLGTIGGLLSLNLALGVPAWIAGGYLLWRWFSANGADFSALRQLRQRIPQARLVRGPKVEPPADEPKPE